MKHDKLPSDSHVIRYVPWAKLRKDEDDKVIGVNWDAFQMRAVDNDLSITWAGYFTGLKPTQIEAAVRAIRASNMKPTPKSGFAVGEVGAISKACADLGHQIRIVHDPAPDNHAHACITRIPRDEMALFEYLASTVWSEVVLNSSIP